MVFRPAVFDRYVSALSVARIGQALSNCGKDPAPGFRRPAAEEPDHRHRRLLGAGGERQCRCSTEQGDELAPSSPYDAAFSMRGHAESKKTQNFVFRHYDQIRFCFRTAKTHLGSGACVAAFEMMLICVGTFGKVLVPIALAQP